MKRFLIFTAFTLLFAISIFAQREQAEVTVASTFLRNAPDYNGAKIRTLQKGERVNYERGREASGWTYVSTADGSVKGWILTNTIQAVKTAAVPTPTPSQTPTPRPTLPQTPTPKPSPSQKPTTAVQPTPPNKTPGTTSNVIPSPAPTATPEVIESDNEAIQIDTEEVNLNVRVVNSSNRPVGNLKESAFRVYEDGVLQPITSVSKTEVPLFNALVIDNSRSLRTQLEKVVEAGKIIIATNKPQDEASVVRFVSADKIEVVQEFTPNKNMINNALDNLYVEGGQTAIIDAVYKAAQMVQKYQNSEKKEDVKLRTLILVSDGDDRGSLYDERLLFELLRNSFVQIYAIGFTNDLSDVPDPETGVSRRQKARAFLTRLATETGGKVYFPESLNELGKIAMEINGELRTQYVVSYSPTNDRRDGSFRKIKVEVISPPNEKRTAITRDGRNAPIK